MKCLKIQVFGKVQGVWFRASAKKEADKLGLQGTVKNLNDGSVLIFVQGEDTVISNFINWCKVGPEFASVKEIKIEDEEVQNLDDFKIIRA